MEFIEFDGVYKYYSMGQNRIAAANGISFCVKKGEFCVVVGPSGAGKTTLLNMLGGMDSCDEGRITVDGAEVLMKHIGGYPGKYDPSVQGSIMVRPPKLFVSGHSHILKVKFDKTLGMLHINPGAAGIYGFHKVRTMVRFTIDGGVFKDLEVIELAG